MDILTLGAFVVLFLLVILVLVKLYSAKAADITPQMLDLKNELNELRTRQLENQNSSQIQQQKLLLDTQNNLNTQLQQMMTIMNQNLNSSQSNIVKQLDSSSRVISDINTKLGTLEKTAENIQELGKNINSLQNILQAPKIRGGFGEYLLEELLKQSLPRENFKTQHTFRDGTKVDAIIKLGDNIVPIDSKFPMESYQRFISADNADEKKKFKKDFLTSVKNRIDETAKYINPAEGTFDFAMMYIPAENIFYEIIISDSVTNKDFELLNYAMSKYVIPVSPNSFYAYLMAIAFGLNGLKIEQEAKTIRGELSHIQSKFKQFYSEYDTLGTHIKNASNKYTETIKLADKLEDHIGRITSERKDLIESK